MIVPLSVLEFRDRAETYFRDKTGVIDGDRTFTYGQYAERTHRLANALRSLGVQRGDRVSFLSHNTHQLLEAYYGVIEAGAILNPINVRLTPQDIGYILNHSGSTAIFYHKDFAPLVQAVRSSLDLTRIFVVLEDEASGIATHEYEGLLASATQEYHPPEFDENDVAELFYTSGTTGKPKGVSLTHRSLHLHAVYSALAIGHSDSDVILHVVPLFHVNGWGTPHTITMCGGTHVVLRTFDPVALLTLIEKHRVTHLLAVAIIYNALVNHPELSRFDVSSLKCMVSGGAPASPTLIRAMEEKLHGEAIVGYGLTETSPVVCLAKPRKHLTDREPPEMKQARQAMTGWATPGAQLRVVDSSGKDVQTNGSQIGEIVVRSNLVMQGYYREPESSDAALQGGWFHTGDMAVVDAEGYLLIKDRSKDIIISGGENISSIEIENVILQHPSVFETAVVSAPDESWGEVPVGIVVLKPGTVATEEEILVHCRTHLAHFKVPKQIHFREQLPKGGTGKILKGELREPFWKGMEKRVH